jgi:probable rRNA maturation factor
VHVVDGLGRPVRAGGLGRWLAATVPRRVAGAVTVALVSDRTMRRLNRRHRAADYATDVLAFPAETADGPAAASGVAGRVNAPARKGRGPGPSLGDIVIATGVAARQARDRDHAPAVEWKVLALHGLLHLIGYDHEGDAGAMAVVERRLRRRGGLPGGLIERAGVGKRRGTAR